jgi:hypothetical protein
VLGKAPERRRTFQGDVTQFAGLYTGRGRGRPITVRIATNGHDITFTNTAATGTPAEILHYYGDDAFGFKETRVTFEKANDKVSKLRLDTGGGYNILSRESDGQK